MPLIILFNPFHPTEKNSIKLDVSKWQKDSDEKTQFSGKFEHYIILNYGEKAAEKLLDFDEKFKVYILGHGIPASECVSSTRHLDDPENVVLDMEQVAMRFEKSFGLRIPQISSVKLYFCNHSNTNRTAKAFARSLTGTENLTIEYYSGLISAPTPQDNYHKFSYFQNNTLRASQTRQTIFHHKKRVEFINLKEQDKYESTSLLKENTRKRFVKIKRDNRDETVAAKRNAMNL